MDEGTNWELFKEFTREFGKMEIMVAIEECKNDKK